MPAFTDPQMQRFFKPISADDAHTQQQRALQQSAVAAAASAAERRSTELARAGPGRPRKQLKAEQVLAVAAVTTEENEGAPLSKRGKYTNWFASPYIHDILAAYQLHLHNSKKAVAYLQRTFPRLPTEAAPRFADLSESTIRSWHDQDGKLLPRYKQVIEEQRAAATRGRGPSRALLGHPEIEDEVKRVLHIMRQRGAVINILIIRLVMRAIIEKNRPQLLADLQLSKSFISLWAREELSWTWRVRTTAASKLPSDWRTQGIQVAKRIAFNMQVYKVGGSHSSCAHHLALPADEQCCDSCLRYTPLL